MTYPSSMRLFDVGFYPLTHDLEQVSEYLSELWLYEDYAYLIDQSLSLIEGVKDEIFPAPPTEPSLHEQMTADDLAKRHEEREAALDDLDQKEAELEILLFAIHRNSHIRLLIEGRGYAIHTAIRNQIGGIEHLSDEVLVYLYSAMKAAQALMEVTCWMTDAEVALFERQGASEDDGKKDRLNETREDYPEVYATILNELRAEDLQGEIEIAIYSSSLLSEAKNARLLASVYPSLDEARRQQESMQITQESKREASAKGGRKIPRHLEWAYSFVEKNIDRLAYDADGKKLSRLRLTNLLLDKILPEERERQLERPNPHGKPAIPSKKALYGNGSDSPGWLVNLGFNQLPDARIP